MDVLFAQSDPPPSPLSSSIYPSSSSSASSSSSPPSVSGRSTGFAASSIVSVPQRFLATIHSLRVRYFLFAAVAVVMLLLPLLSLVSGNSPCSSSGGCPGGAISNANRSLLSGLPHRKFLIRRSVLAKEEPNRMWGEKCTTADIVINQGPTSPLPNGTPTYTVEIMNVCVTGCDISRIHITCGWFSSARLVNPKVFKRVRYNDCLVNNGKPLPNGGTLSFEYANTYSYPLTVSSVVCR
ncbi:unnamed protein product [Linum tenue]|uniref:Protein TAPETUM DETERMINANT 1-like n=1 Tax=Linum tenue TaxID=586396 RepID=A0AAV0MKT5_9ROSI|nr:unnamed protein product [Linum tenue]